MLPRRPRGRQTSGRERERVLPQDRYDTWRSLDAEEKEEPEEQEEDAFFGARVLPRRKLLDAAHVCQDHASDSRRKKSAAIANKIRGLKAERNSANGT